MSVEWVLVILALMSGLYMAWSIGANDVANAVGTAVGAGSLSLRHAVYLAGIFEFLGAWLFGREVTQTIQKGIIDQQAFAQDQWTLALGMVACLFATGFWLQLASYWGWPVSTTHSIVGAVVGFALATVGYRAIRFDSLLFIASSWIFSPLIGGLVGFILFYLLRQNIFYTHHPLLRLKRIGPSLALTMVLLLSFVLFAPQWQIIDLLSRRLMVIATAGASLVAYLLVQRWIDRRLTIIASLPIKERPQVDEGFASAIAHLQEMKRHAHSEQKSLIEERIEELRTLGLQVAKSTHHDEMVQVERLFSRFQVVSACFMAFSHGANDVSNAVGPLAAALKAIPASQEVPLYLLLLLGGIGIVAGLAIWGWRVIETVGKKITSLTPSRGFSAELACSCTVLGCAQLGLPVSTTHTLVGSILGVGLARGLSALNVGTLRDIAVSWAITIPAGALLSWLSFQLIVHLL